MFNNRPTNKNVSDSSYQLLTQQDDQEDQLLTALSETKIPNNNSAQSSALFSHEQKENKQTIESETSLDKIVTNTDIDEKNPIERAKKIIEKFNTRAKQAKVSIISEANVRTGYRLEPDQFLLAHINKVPQLAMSLNGNRLVADFTGFYTESGVIGVINQNDQAYGAHGSYVINVPTGFYAKAFTANNTPLLFNEGVHVIHDPFFKFNKDFVNQSENYIAHGNLHILRVPEGNFAKIFVKGKAHLLPPRNEPYVFNTPFFQFDKTKDFVSQNERYIKHGTQHILYVPAGSIAKIWIGSEPRLLESRKEPYKFDDPLFKLETTRKENIEYLFESATAAQIIHGSLKRIIPPINSVAITNNNGKLEIISTSKLITDAKHAFIAFLNTGLQTLDFPSESTKAKRLNKTESLSN